MEVNRSVIFGKLSTPDAAHLTVVSFQFYPLLFFCSQLSECVQDLTKHDVLKYNIDYDEKADLKERHIPEHILRFKRNTFHGLPDTAAHPHPIV